jgi:3-deoxy-7-phosphoheptulonate synthase/chorismate mutase
MNHPKLGELRQEINGLNEQILKLVQARARVVVEIGRLKRELGLDGFDPLREEEMLRDLTAKELAPLSVADVKTIFKSIFRAALEIQDRERERQLRVSRRDLVPAHGIRVGNVSIGAAGGDPALFVGPCSVETADQIDTIAEFVARLPGTKILRAGAFKPRTSPYAFQGLRVDGLKLLRAAADRHGLATVTEVLDTATLDVVASHSDMLQVGARNMYNTELLKAIGRSGKPVLLKRCFMSTIEELLLSAEYILNEGNEAVVLCERGIRTFERATRNTLDISAVPLLKQATSLPVIVDLSHALGRTDIMLPCARAAIAAGGDGLMIEIHNAPDRALSDGMQQMKLDDCAALVTALGLGSAKRASEGTA